MNPGIDSQRHFTGFRPIAGSPAIDSHQKAASASAVQHLDG
jgi:hypothetical protein